MNEIKAWLSAQYLEIGVALVPELLEGSACWTDVDERSAEVLDSVLGMCVRLVVLDQQKSAFEEVLSTVQSALDKVATLDVRSGISAAEADNLGAWQVHVVWIVDPTCRQSWELAIRELRRSSSHSEEIGIDILEPDQGSVRSRLNLEGLPCFMFNSRKLLNLSFSELPKWRSPDANFENQLHQYVNGILDEQQKEFVSGVIARSQEGEDLPSSEPSNRITEVDDSLVLSVAEFRNVVSATIEMPLDGRATVLHGPNGTGKSSLFEAFSIAMFGTSPRHLEYLGDQDVPAKERQEYVRNALHRFGSQNQPSVSFGGEETIGKLALTPEEAKRRLSEASGTLLAQESAREFVKMSSREVAGVVLSDFSPRARKIQDIVDRGAQQAKSAWQDWLRANGLNASIAKQETILTKLAEQALNDRCPPVSAMLYQWLAAVSRRFGNYEAQARSLHQSLEDLDSTTGRENVVKSVVAAILGDLSAKAPLVRWLRERSTRLDEIYEMAERLKSEVEALRSDWPSIKRDLSAWRNWLAHPVKKIISDAASNNEDERMAMASQRRLEELAPLGLSLRIRKEHLDSVVAGLLSKWSTSHPHNCPTCDAQHLSGIATVVSQLQSEVSSNYESMRREYAEIQAELKRIQERRADIGAPPVSDQRMLELGKLLNVRGSDETSLDVALRGDENFLSELIHQTEATFAFPKKTASMDAEDLGVLADGIASEVIQMRAEGLSKQEEPLRWDDLKKRVDSLAIDVVGTHLPRTLGAVWNEISSALAPARWNQIATPRMHVDLQRGSERVGVVVDRENQRVPVRHILNQAEQHVLGLAWFFTRHLSHGRFVTPLIVMDDPAQEMDQVTYRKFVRFVQSFLRLHRSTERKTRLVVFLHQEERALDLARATALDGAVTILDWAKEVRMDGPRATVRLLRLRNPEQRAPIPMVRSRTSPTPQVLQ
ncbi:AAA family ATPase [Stenotrophomonas sp.]|uniref:ATP-binding protein n=1 Tax=Stenotrophomonas sp. TaxID=69392 RepID=UPI0028AE1CF0|nr:AAA family ATPase [Stenotrophomonas sp.]